MPITCFMFLNSRTARILSALAFNVPIVTESWVYSCLENMVLVNPRDVKCTEEATSFSSTDSAATLSSIWHPRFGHRAAQPGSVWYQSCNILAGRRVFIKSSNKRNGDKTCLGEPTLKLLAKRCGALSVVNSIKSAHVAIIGNMRFQSL